MKKLLLLTITLPILAVVIVVLVLGCFYWYVPYQKDQVLRDQWRQEEVTAERLKILEEHEEKLKKAKSKEEKFEALADIGLIRYGLSDFEGAVKYWKKALELDPENSLVWYNLGNAYKNLERFLKAEEAYKKAINNSPGADPLFYNALADLYWFKMPEKKGDIVSVYTLGLLKNPPSKIEKIGLLKGLAGYYEKIGNKEMALKYYEKIQEIDPSYKIPK